MNATVYNYATFLMDDGIGLPYITDVATKKRLYRLPVCDLCGMQPLSFTGKKDGWACCEQHAAARCERNDNDA